MRFGAKHLWIHEVYSYVDIHIVKALHYIETLFETGKTNKAT